jgi:hypothetical protein
MPLTAETTSSCARTDAKPLDRDVQMKYDIAKNEEGPLRRTIRAGASSQDVSNPKGKQRQIIANNDRLSRERHSGLDERFVNMETHLAVRYGKQYLHMLLDAWADHVLQYLLLHGPYSIDSNSWKIISYASRKTIHLGQLFISINLTAG